jgi:L-asparagine oxygenase
MLELELLELSKNIKASPSDNPYDFYYESKKMSEKVSEEIREKLIHFSKHGSESGCLLLDGFSTEDVISIKTPEDNNQKIGETTNLAKIQSILINVMGEQVAYEAEGYGRIFQDIIPMKSMEKKQMSVSSGTELEIHTEQAFSKLRPDILSLACLRGDEQAFTYILPVNYIIENLTEYEIQLLRKPLWKTSVDLSFKLCGKEFIEGDIRGPIPIISGPENNPKLVFDQDLMTGINDEAQQMISKIVNIYYSKRLKYNLKPGQIIFIDNNRAVHGRSCFTPKYDGYDRFLIRCFSIFDEEKLTYVDKNSRMIEAIYS